MAQLLSAEVDTPSMLVLSPGPPKQVGDQDWQYVMIELISGRRDIRTLENEDVLLCRKPSDEMAQLIHGLGKLMIKEKEQVLFEPSEPSFELSFVRSRRDGIKVEAWLDAGNGTTGICTWDSAGIRFFTDEDRLQTFILELGAEFEVCVPGVLAPET